MKKLSLDKALNLGWENFKKNLFGVLGIWLLVTAFSLLTSLYNPTNLTIDIVYQFTVVIVMFYLSVVVIQAYIMAAKGKQISASIFKVNPLHLIYLIVMAVIVILPAIIAAVPILVEQPLLYIIIGPLLLIYAIYASIYFSQGQYLIIDQNKNPIDALKTSHNMMKGNGFKYYLLWMCLMGINFLGLMFLLVGFIITAPLTEVIKAQVYKNLS